MLHALIMLDAVVRADMLLWWGWGKRQKRREGETAMGRGLQRGVCYAGLAGLGERGGAKQGSMGPLSGPASPRKKL